jgi:hypothetical protein
VMTEAQAGLDEDSGEDDQADDLMHGSEVLGLAYVST